MMRKVTTARAQPASPSPRPSSLFPCSLHHSSSSRSLPPLPSSRIPAPLSQDLTPHSPLQAAVAIANRGLRFGLNAWVERSAELSRRRALLRSVTPEARAMRKGFNSWCAMLDAYAHLLYATAALRHREVFVALNTWRGYARERREAIALMTRAAAALSQRGQRMAINMWIEVAGERMARRALLRSMTPKARAMRRALNSWTACARRGCCSGVRSPPSSTAACVAAGCAGAPSPPTAASGGRRSRARSRRSRPRGARDAARSATGQCCSGSGSLCGAVRWPSAPRTSDGAQRLDRGRGRAAGGARAHGPRGRGVAQRRERARLQQLDRGGGRARRAAAGSCAVCHAEGAEAMRRALNSWREMATNRRTALELMRRAGARCAGAGSVWR